MNSIKHIASWLGILVYLVVAMSFVSRKTYDTLCYSIQVNVLDSTRNRFVGDADIKDMLDVNKFKILGYPVDKINTHAIENVIAEHTSVKASEAYMTQEGILNIDVEQREPVVRIMGKNNTGFYLDKNGFIMPLSNKFSSHIIIANGNIRLPGSSHFRGHYSSLKDKYQSEKDYQVIEDLYELSSYLYRKPFWKAQFVQLYVDQDREFELIPRVGSHIIQLGGAEQFDVKLRKLEALYLKGLPKYGWNNYEVINLKYNNQVICVKR